MEKFNTIKMKYIVLLLIVGNCVFSQQKIIVPKSGTIVFYCKEEKLESNLKENFEKKSSKSFKESIKKSIRRERKDAGIFTDSIKLNSAVESINNLNFEEILSNENTKFSIEYEDTIVIKKEIKNNILQNIVSINCKSRIFKNDFATGFYDFSEIKIISFKEYRNLQKKIGDFNCFKVEYSFVETSEDDAEFSNFMSNYPIKREIWVTDKIESTFHPVINEKIILEKYYPLEISEISEMRKGIKTLYLIEKFNLK
jgi:hypothetical protein